MIRMIRAPRIAHLLAALAVLTALPAAARWDRSVVSLPLPNGSLEVQVTPERGSSLTFERDSDDLFRYRGATSDLVGRPYSIELRNRSDERLKVVVAVDGVNVYWKAPLVGTSDADVGSVLEPRERREISGFQVDRNTAQQFVFSPPEWSEGAERTEWKIGAIEVQVYREWRPRNRAVPQDRKLDEGREQEARPRAESQSAGAEPPIGTTAGEDIGNQVRGVRFVSETRSPISRAVLVYGRPDERAEGVRLGIRGNEERDGIRVIEVLPRTVAQDAGLFAGDLITKVDSVSSPRLAELQRVLDRKRQGDYLFLEIERRAHRLSIKIRLD